MNHHYNTANYNQCPSYNLIHPLNTTLPMSNNPIPYLMPISSYSSPTQSLSPSFNVDTSSHKPLQSPNVHSTQKRKTIDENLEHFSSTSSYSSIISFPEANSPLKKSKSTPIPSREETESSEDEAKLRQRVLERNRLAASKCRQRKKEWIKELAHKAERMSRENEHLKQLLLQLKEETLFLKTQLMTQKGYAGDLGQNKDYLNMF